MVGMCHSGMVHIQLSLTVFSGVVKIKPLLDRVVLSRLWFRQCIFSFMRKTSVGMFLALHMILLFFKKSRVTEYCGDLYPRAKYEFSM